MSHFNDKPAFGVGTRVRVASQRNKYPTEKLVGLCGVVCIDTGTNVAVLFDNVRNHRSAYGYFYFSPADLLAVDEYTVESKEDENMVKSRITNYLNVVQVEYADRDKDGVYQYANFDAGLNVGDYCVVMTEYGIFRVARVMKVLDQTDIECYREVVTKLFTDEYDARVKLRAKAAEVKAKMEARARQLQDIALYQMLAKDDPDMAALFSEYQNLVHM